MNKIQLLLMTAPISESKADKVVSILRRIAGVKISVVGELPSVIRANPAIGGRRRAVLSPRQVEVIREMALGTRTKDIARILNVSVKTVESHRQQLMARLGIWNIPGLVRYALRTGILSSDWLMK